MAALLASATPALRGLAAVAAATQPPAAAARTFATAAASARQPTAAATRALASMVAARLPAAPTARPPNAAVRGFTSVTAMRAPVTAAVRAPGVSAVRGLATAAAARATNRSSAPAPGASAAQMRSAELPLLAIVGAPNVGKSTLFNRLVRNETSYTSFRPRALVSAIAGTTRDRIEATCTWDDMRFRVQDTGGVLDLQLEQAAGYAAKAMEQKMEQQVLQALEEASVILCVVDGPRGVMPIDEGLAQILRKLKK